MTGAERSVHIFLGSGGVGKTTLAASWAVAGALGGERVVVLTIDPARRLADAMGLTAADQATTQGRVKAVRNEPSLVEGPWGGQLWAAMLDPAETLTALLAEHGTAEQVERNGAA